MMIIGSAWRSGPVRSLAQNLKDRDRDRSSIFGKAPKTGPNHGLRSFAVLRPVLTGCGLNRFKTGLNRSYGQKCAKKFLLKLSLLYKILNYWPNPFTVSMI